jgi:hypothetical protein
MDINDSNNLEVVETPQVRVSANNKFKFILFQGNTTLCEAYINADHFNPITRYSINVKDIFKDAIAKLQTVLSEKFYDIIIEVGRKDQSIEDSENKIYDLLEYQTDMINSYPIEYRNDMKYNPQPSVKEIEGRTVKSVECKIGFYINDKTIIERDFYVNGFNPQVKYSVDLKEAVQDITEVIFAQIKKSDIKNMWDNYDLINIKGFSINQINEFSPYKRAEILKSMRN